MRKVSTQGTSVGVTLPVEFGFKTGDQVIWDIVEDGTITLSKIDIIGGIPQYTVIDRDNRKDALYEQIKKAGELIKEDFLLARFAINRGVALRTVRNYRDELLEGGVIQRVDDTLQVV
jgi:hypothetical protein